MSKKQTKKKRKLTGLVAFAQNCLLKRVTEGQAKGRREARRGEGRIRRQLLDDLKEIKLYRKIKAEAIDRTVWRIRFGRGCGPVVRQTTERKNYLQRKKSDYHKLNHQRFEKKKLRVQSEETFVIFTQGN